MARESINRCVWLVDTIRRYRRITRRELDALWMRSALGNGKPMSRRTFYNHRDMVEELFNLRIECDESTYEYYIAHDDSNADNVANWLLNTMSLNDLLAGSREVSHRIFVEDVPSARDHLGLLIEAIKANCRVTFSYHSYTRSMPAQVVMEPYFVKLFKQRWYVVGRVVGEDRVKTYALDRVKDITARNETFELPPDFDPAGYFSNSYGIVVTQSEVRKVVLKVEPIKAKYIAALPLHHSQTQTVADGYSLFTLHLRLTDDFVQELLSHGAGITVLEPAELRTRMVQELRKALDNYR
ncbi:MAG: WYL domain-containing protein [Odoribacter sp.]|nr:WYL domain-containing protein [Odoribacter sp.]